MFSLYGADESIRNIYRISHPFLNGRAIRTSLELRACYLDFLSDHQPYMPLNWSEDIVVADPIVEDALVAAYGHNATLNDLGQAEVIGEAYPEAVWREKIALARAALETFRDLDDELAALFDLVVHSLVIRPSRRPMGRASYGGSSSAAIGAIWLSLGPTVTQHDVVEMLLHELTHHLLFIDERNHPHFDYGLIAREENRAFSAILNLIRPVDKVLHSVVVATELILARRRFLPAGRGVVHPESSKMVADAVAACDSLEGLATAGQVLRPRTREILARCRAVLSPLAVEARHVA